MQDRGSGFVAGFTGAAAGDEPHAVRVASQILSVGGSAADAVTAAYFTMAATLPGSASLGGGGLCLVHDPAQDAPIVLDFHDPQARAATAGAPLPGAMRGFMALQGRHGRLAWTEVVAPGERAARFGITVSRALARDLEAASRVLGQDPAMAALFLRPDGSPLREGDRLVQPALAETLRIIGTAPTRVVSPAFAEWLAADYRTAGIDMRAEDMLAHAPRWQTPLSVRVGTEVADFPPHASGHVQAQIWAMLVREGLWGRRGDPRLVAEASRRAYADSGRLHFLPDPGGAEDSFLAPERIRQLLAGAGSPPRKDVPGFLDPLPPTPVDQGSASIMAVDQNGLAVACSLTMNGLMGAVRLAPRSGIVIAATPDPARRGSPPVALMSLRQHGQNRLLFLGAGTGGPGAGPALIETALATLREPMSLENGLARSRIFATANPDQAVIESGPGAQALADTLQRAGYTVITAGAVGRLNAFVCPAGFTGADSRCEIRSDRRGFGIATTR